VTAAPRLLIFDLDGTLVDSQDQIARCFNHALCSVDVEPVPHEAVYAMIGLPLSHMFAQILPEALHCHIDGCVAVYRERYDRAEIPISTPFHGVLETLEACRAAGRTLTVATTKFQEVADRVVDAAGLRPYFALVLGGDQVPQHKPHPAMVLHTLERFGAAPREALVVGDSNYDMLMAAGAGVAACGVTYGAQPAEALIAAGAGFLIDAMPELLPIVGVERNRQEVTLP
jgi:phosphoglycolate phosphatase